MAKQKQAPAKVPAKSASAKPVTTSAATPSAVSIVGAPELIVTRATDKGVSCVIKNVRLTWVFVKNYREDKEDWRKGAKSVTMLIPKKGVANFQKSLADAVKQTISLNKKIVDGPTKMEVFKTALAINVERSLLKDGDTATDSAGNPREEYAGMLTWQAKKSAMRDSKEENFPEEYPLSLQDSLGKAVLHADIDRVFYSGVYADVALTLATFDVKGNQGVTGYLNGLRKVRDGERLGNFDPFAGVAPAGNETPEAADVDFL